MRTLGEAQRVLQISREKWSLAHKQSVHMAELARAEKNPKKRALRWKQYDNLVKSKEAYRLEGERAKEFIERWKRTTDNRNFYM